MKKAILLLAISLLGIAGAIQAATPLVDVEWVLANTGKPGVVFVDIRGKTAFLRGHIPGAVDGDYKKSGWQIKNDEKTVGMLPSSEQLAGIIGGLGIGNNDHVVIVDQGSRVMARGTRIYWTFKVSGHKKLSLLNGGMNAYRKSKKNPIEKGAVDVVAKTYRVDLQSDMIPSKTDVKKALDAGMNLLDSRPVGQYVGVFDGNKTKRKGTIPGARNVPYNWHSVNGKGEFLGETELKNLYQGLGLSTSGEQITFCNTGVAASVSWFALHELIGNDQVRMYDGSMTEWSADSSMPMERKISY